MIDIKKIKKCRFCEYFFRRTKEELFKCKSIEEEQSFNGYCHRYPKKEKVTYDYVCGEWLNKKDNCSFKDIDGFCTINSIEDNKHLCEDLVCGIDLHKE
jgi:hypothetical protein